MNATLFSNRAASYMKMSKWEEALKDCTSAIEIDEKYAKAYVRRANCHLQLKNFDDAVRDYESAKEIDPDYPEIKKLIKDAQLEKKKAGRKDYYQILGVTKNADEQEIQKGYKKAALKWHPGLSSLFTFFTIFF
jgi:DnaJ family protein C protein 7